MMGPVLVMIVVVGWVQGEQMTIVSVSEDVMVREGERVNLTCATDQDWFFCLWRHPRGVKECSIQEGGGYRSVCQVRNIIEFVSLQFRRNDNRDSS